MHTSLPVISVASQQDDRQFKTTSLADVKHTSYCVYC